MEQFDLTRFLVAQARDYATALAELRTGEKRSHWMWYVFPQLRESVKALLDLPPATAEDVMGPLDAQKLRSSLTLFRVAVPGERLFGDALARYFRGRMDPQTLTMLEG